MVNRLKNSGGLNNPSQSYLPGYSIAEYLRISSSRVKLKTLDLKITILNTFITFVDSLSCHLLINAKHRTVKISK